MSDYNVPVVCQALDRLMLLFRILSEAFLPMVDSLLYLILMIGHIIEKA